MIEALFEGIIHIAAELLFDGEVIAKAFGWIGAGLAWVHTLGRSEWKAADWQAMTTGLVVVMIVAGVGADAWIRSAPALGLATGTQY